MARGYFIARGSDSVMIVPNGLGFVILPRYAEHRLPIFGQLRPGGFKGGYATTYCGCLAAPIGVLCLVVYRVDLLRRFVWSASVAGAVECWFGSRFGEARIG